jgi:parallel beta-helix repeat protein
LENNIFPSNELFPIYLLNSGNNTVYSNEINNPLISPITSSTESGIVLIGGGSTQNQITENNITYGDYGIYITEGGMDNNISKNNLIESQTGIKIEFTSFSILHENNYENNTEGGCFIEEAHYTTIQGENLRGGENGYFVRNSDFVTISDLKIEDTDFGLIIFLSNNMEITNVSIYSRDLGVGILGGDTTTIWNTIVENCSVGFWLLWDADNVKIHNSQISDSVSEAVLVEGSEGVTFYNCSFDALNNNFNLSLGTVILFNTTYNQTRIKLDNSSSISLNWLVDIRVLDWMGNPADSANVQIRKPTGTIIYNGVTDVNGYLTQIWGHERTQYTFSNETSTPYTINAILGNHAGSAIVMLNQSTLIIINLENSQPIASNVVISPTLPTTVFDLTLSYMFTDPENDPEGSSIILWYIDGVLNSTFNNLITIDSQYTKKDQTWFCEVIPHDGAVYGIPMTSTPVTIQNTAPSVSNVAIDKLNPTSSESLVVSYDYFDIDSDLEGLSLHRWYVDFGSGFFYSGVDSLELDSVYTQKDEVWKCIVTPSDGDDLGVPLESANVTIGNSAPEVSDLTISPSLPASNETLNPVYSYYDIDSDSELASEIRWFKDKVEQTDLFGTFSVDPSKTQKGEEWYYLLTPSDGTDFGAPIQSDAVIIANTPPSVSNILITPQFPNTADDLLVNYTYYDEDGDLESDDTIIKWYRMRPGDIQFSYTGYQGKTLSSTFTTKDEIWKCEVIPHDGLNYGMNVMSASEVTIGNSPPSASNVYITPSNPTTQDTLTANYDYLDLDSDLEDGTEIIWFRDGMQDSSLNNLLTVSWDQTQKDQVWYFQVISKDGLDLGIPVQSPSITIQNSAPEAKPNYHSEIPSW